MDDLLLEPLKYYTSYARETHKNNVAEHFNGLLSSSGVNVEENRRTVDAYNGEMSTADAISRKIRKYRILTVLLIIVAVLSIVALIAGVYFVSTENFDATVLIICGIAFTILSLTLIFAVLRPKITHQEGVRNKHLQKANELKNLAYDQMMPLNALFDDLDTLRLIEKTMPKVKFDQLYSTEREEKLIADYDYIDMTDDETSVINTLSGTVFDNPFLYERYLSHFMGTNTYTGTLVIRWTESYRDSEGKVKYRTRTQTLHASVTKPKPFYKMHTHLGFGSDAAPDLSFTRKESDTDELSEKALEKRIRKGEKELQNRSEKATMRGGSFQEMANSEFDVLFGALDRNHEVQFRLMYTPLAQRNTVDLLRSKEGYGDDFNFIKRGRFNIISSNHAQGWDMALSGARFHSYSVDIAQNVFQSFNEEYFKSIFFDLAPLLAVPAYQDKAVSSMKDFGKQGNNYTYYEYESLANAIGEKVFAPSDASTRSILKASFIERQGDVDRVAITAYSYRAEDRIDYIPVFGGDGRTHLVPVHWIEYIPVSNTSEMLIKSLGYTEKQLRDKGKPLPYQSAYLHGLLAYHSILSDSWENINQNFNVYK